MSEFKDERKYPRVTHAGISPTENRTFCIAKKEADRLHLMQPGYNIHMYELDKNGNYLYRFIEDVGDLTVIRRGPVSFEELLGAR